MTEKEIRKFFKKQNMHKKNCWTTYTTYEEALIKNIQKLSKEAQSLADKYEYEILFYNYDQNKIGLESLLIAQIKSKYGYWRFFYLPDQTFQLLHHNYSVQKDTGEYIEAPMLETEWHIQQINSNQKPRNVYEIFSYINKHDKSLIAEINKIKTR